MALLEHGHDRLLVALTIALVIGICTLDLTLPPEASIVALYVIPIMLSLLSAKRWLALAIILLSLSLATMGFLLPSDGPSVWTTQTNRALGLMTVTAAACLGLICRRLGEEKQTALALQYEHAVPPRRILCGLLPICSSCKNIRDNDGCWMYLETYIEARSDTRFTHSLCPECLHKLYDSLEKRGREKQDEPLLTR